MRLRWTATALDDLRGITLTVARDSPKAALKLEHRLVSSARALPTYPYRGRKGRLEQTRELVVHPNYLLVYEIDGDIVRILTVIHAAQRWP